MIRSIRDLFFSFRAPRKREVYFKSLSLNRRIVFWYANHVVKHDSFVEPPGLLHEIDRLRKNRDPLTFICNHLSYADSHIIETLLIRYGFEEMANHLIHIAGQKTYHVSRRSFTRSLNTIRVYQPKASLEKSFKRKMNSKALKWAAHLKRKGYSLLVFPEGTRSRRKKQFNPHSANPKTTVYFRNSYVVPLALMGSENVMPVGKTIPRSATVRMRIGDPVRNVDVENALRLEITNTGESEFRQCMMLQYMKRIESLLEPDYRSN